MDKSCRMTTGVRQLLPGRQDPSDDKSIPTFLPQLPAHEGKDCRRQVPFSRREIHLSAPIERRDPPIGATNQFGVLG